MYEDIRVEWRRLRSQDDEDWQCFQCLYAYVYCPTSEVIYIGKADRCTVRERWKGRDKRALVEWVRDQGMERAGLHIGTIDWGGRLRYSPEKLADVESLLIKRVQPRGNIMATRSRIERPGIRVICEGEWPHRRISFVDV